LKIKSIIFVWISLTLSMIALQTFWAYILLCVIGIWGYCAFTDDKDEKANTLHNFRGSR